MFAKVPLLRDCDIVSTTDLNAFYKTVTDGIHNLSMVTVVSYPTKFTLVSYRVNPDDGYGIPSLLKVIS